jgi:hypothetical protein
VGWIGEAAGLQTTFLIFGLLVVVFSCRCSCCIAA